MKFGEQCIWRGIRTSEKDSKPSQDWGKEWELHSGTRQCQSHGDSHSRIIRHESKSDDRDNVDDCTEDDSPLHNTDDGALSRLTFNLRFSFTGDDSWYFEIDNKDGDKDGIYLDNCADSDDNEYNRDIKYLPDDKGKVLVYSMIVDPSDRTIDTESDVDVAATANTNDADDEDTEQWWMEIYTVNGSDNKELSNCEEWTCTMHMSDMKHLCKDTNALR